MCVCTPGVLDLKDNAMVNIVTATQGPTQSSSVVLIIVCKGLFVRQLLNKPSLKIQLNQLVIK